MAEARVSYQACVSNGRVTLSPALTHPRRPGGVGGVWSEGDRVWEGNGGHHHHPTAASQTTRGGTAFVSVSSRCIRGHASPRRGPTREDGPPAMKGRRRRSPRHQPRRPPRASTAATAYFFFSLRRDTACLETAQQPLALHLLAAAHRRRELHEEPRPVAADVHPGQSGELPPFLRGDAGNSLPPCHPPHFALAPSSPPARPPLPPSPPPTFFLFCLFRSPASQSPSCSRPPCLCAIYGPSRHRRRAVRPWSSADGRAAAGKSPPHLLQNPKTQPFLVPVPRSRRTHARPSPPPDLSLFFRHPRSAGQSRILSSAPV